MIHRYNSRSIDQCVLPIWTDGARPESCKDWHDSQVLGDEGAVHPPDHPFGSGCGVTAAAHDSQITQGFTRRGSIKRTVTAAARSHALVLPRNQTSTIRGKGEEHHVTRRN